MTVLSLSVTVQLPSLSTRKTEMPTHSLNRLMVSNVTLIIWLEGLKSALSMWGTCRWHYNANSKFMLDDNSDGTVDLAICDHSDSSRGSHFPGRSTPRRSGLCCYYFLTLQSDSNVWRSARNNPPRDLDFQAILRSCEAVLEPDGATSKLPSATFLLAPSHRPTPIFCHTYGPVAEHNAIH